jgi:CheY-like chemotaxis protein/AraC-like DNA-binding protein
MQQEQEQKSYEEKVQMLINISHELRTPLTLVMAPLKRLLKETSPDQENYSTLNRIYRQSRRMRDILNMVLDLRKMEVGKSRLKIEATDAYRWIMEVTSDIIDEEKAENIDIDVNVDPEASDIWIDRQKCETVMTNILMNAIKHSQSGDKISIRAERGDSCVRISISDQGPGLADADMTQMFTRFYQSGGEKYGSGIGLAYSKILVELHGGNIGAYSNDDRGATFWWEVPLTPVSQEEQVTSARAYLNELMGYNPGLEISAPEIEVFNTSGMTLMLVDDNYDLLAFLREALNAEFADIMMAQSGNQALKMISTGKLPDIIVSDVNMPDGDGFQLCNAIKSNDRFNHIPVVLLTARGDEHDQSDSYKLGADGFIPKPFEMETLTELLRGLLRKRSEVKKRYLSNEDSPADFGSEEEAFIIRFNKIVSEHLGDPDLDQQLICRELGVSRALLYNKMKAIVGTGAKEYITHIRIEKAKSLMENPSLSIADIAEMTGFTSQSYFSTAFKSQTGMTPSQYRQKDKS